METKIESKKIETLNDITLKEDFYQSKMLKENALITYEYECKREDSIIRQAIQLQALFSFVSLLLINLANIIANHYEKFSDYIMRFILLIILILFISLCLSSFAQIRRKATSFASIKNFNNQVYNDNNDDIHDETYFNYQYTNYLAEIQESKRKNNNKRITFLFSSFIFFFSSLVLSILLCIVAICII